MPLELIEEPNQVKLIDIRISEVSPTNSNGESWDENSPPDIFVEFYYQSGNIEYTDTLHDVSLSSSNNVFTDRSLILDNPQDRIFYTVFESMVCCNLSPSKPQFPNDWPHFFN